MRVSRILIILSIFIINNAFAQSGKGTVEGTITTADNQAATFVNIGIKGGTIGISTDENGRFKLVNVPAGPQTLIISAVGFEPIEKIVTVADNETTKVEASLTASVAELSEVTVTGQKRRTSTATKNNIELLNVPMSIQVIDQTLIQQQQIIDMKDVIKNVSGVNQTGSYNGGYQYFNARGFDMNNWTNFRRNGTLLWNMGNHFADFYESVEFLKGPTAILYGDVAPGGIINFVTKKPLNYDYRRFDLKIGEYGLFRPSFDISGALNENKTVLYRLNTTYEKSNSFRDVVENETYMIAPSITWNVSPKLSWTVEATHKRDERVGDPGLVSPDGTFEGLRQLSTSTFLGEREATYSYVNSSVFSTAKFYLNNTWSLQNVTSFTTTERTPLNVYVNNDADSLGNVSRYQYFFNQRFNTWTTMLDLVGEFYTGNIRHKVLVGADFVADENRLGGFVQEDIGGRMNLFNPQYGQAQLRALPRVADNYEGFYTRVGLYAQDQISLMNDRFNILLGVRYNEYVNSTRYDNAADEPEDNPEVRDNPIVPRVGIVFKPQPWVSLYGSYAESYEINGFDWIEVTRLIPPTFGKQLEFGVKADLFNRRLGVTLAAFNLEKENVYSWGYSEAEPEFEYVSWTPDYGGYYTYLAQLHRSRGIELDVNGKVNENLTLLATASFIQAEIVEDVSLPAGNWLANQPREMFSLWANYDFTKAIKGLSLGYGIYYKGEFFATPDNLPGGRVPSNYTMDAAIGYNLGNLALRVNVTNLTDRISYLGSFGTWEPQWRRRVIAGISYKF